MKTPLKIAALALLVLAWGQISSSAQTDGAFKLTHRSSFTGAPERNPFWPIGWVKGQDTQTDVQETAVPITEASFVVTSISSGNSTPLAVINGKTYGEGETIVAMYGSQKIKIQVVAINDGEVVLQYLDKKYTVKMKEPVLNHHSDDDSDALLKKNDNVLILH